MEKFRVKVVDAICGAGKTTAAINYINHPSNSGERFMYVTPYLTEVQRIKESTLSKIIMNIKMLGYLMPMW